jgi:coenzyme F420 hydrogenase subunit beta
VSHELFSKETFVELRQAWGPVLGVWEGYASDPEIRFKGSSGGVVTALALFCLEKGLASAVLQVGAKADAPLENASFFSKSREELMACAGSRYAPAAPCEGLNRFEESDSPCVFIGKPCDVVALRKARATNAKLDRNVALAISIFCAGTPSMAGTSKILESLSIKPEEVGELRYRGCGWPGETVVKIKGCDGQSQMSYEQSWSNILTKYVSLRCRLCPDGTGELADISCGDPWYRDAEANDAGHSIVLVRTEKGRQLLNKAVESGYVQLSKVEPKVLPLSQKSLFMKRCNLWGRLLAMRILRVPVPKYRGFALFRNWLGLPAIGKMSSVLSTFHRIITQRLWRFLPDDGRISNCMNEMEEGFEGRRKLGTNNG